MKNRADKLERLSEAIAALLPAPPGQGSALRDNIDALLRANFEKMNLATREQLDIQEKVLHRTRARVRDLEKQVAELEKRLGVTDEEPTPTGGE